MSLLKASDYSKLGDVSSAAMKKSKKGKFHAVFITGEMRTGQEIGKLQCMIDMDKGEYAIQNQKQVLFIPYFIKRYWTKYIETHSQDGQKYNKLVAFGWEDDVPKMDEDCRYVYTVGCLLLDEKGQAMKHLHDIEDAGIKAGDPLLGHFTCHGMKFQSVMTLLNRIEEKAKNLTPLTEDPELEQNVISPRRFICSASVTTADSNFGTKMIYDFNVAKQIPDESVAKVMDSAMSLVDDFKEQFDKTSYVRGISSEPTTQKPHVDAPVFTEAPNPVPENNLDTGDSFNLGI